MANRGALSIGWHPDNSFPTSTTVYNALSLLLVVEKPRNYGGWIEKCLSMLDGLQKKTGNNSKDEKRVTGMRL